ncbi:MAG: YebC/PmpR family DNA-binding transcriptional regulator [Coriobacteriia bacterium]|jgi:YebC/PmpR family DNA-binding regulatory protein|nr:YebC/PmpR family DNA-binding transcriptional regulator [Coriobacteriia bacterium]
MAGHSKWATTKHRKAAQDKKRSALFSKLSRIITVAAKTGGDPNPENNASLAAAIAKAKSYSLPKDKIEAAIAKAFGSGDTAAFEEVVYEGYGPAGVAIYVEALTDNRNRTAADVRSAFTRAGGNLGATGSVAFQFERKGQVTLELAGSADEDELMLAVAEAGGEDLESTGEEWVVTTGPTDAMQVKGALEAQGLPVKGAERVMEPVNETIVTPQDAS